MKASFGADISKLKNVSSVWMDDATYKDVSGKATFTQSETDEITKVLSTTGSVFRRINSSLLGKFLKLQGSMTGNLSGASLKTYNNTKVRQGEEIKNVKQHAQGYLQHIEMHFEKLKQKVTSLTTTNIN